MRARRTTAANSTGAATSGSAAPVGRRPFLAGAIVLAPLYLAGIGGCASDERVLVTGGVSAERAGAYRELAEQGIGDVEDLWGADAVPVPVPLDLPRSSAAWALATGAGQWSGGEYAASTVWQDSVGRIVVHPDTWSAASPQGRSAVITHEIAHLAMGQQPQVPWWVTEGLAEYTAHRGRDRSLSDIAGSALAPLTTDPPRAWPTRSEADNPWQDYAPAWLACVYLARTYSESSLLDLHSDLAGGLALGSAMQSRFGADSAQIHQDWARWLRDV